MSSTQTLEAGETGSSGSMGSSGLKKVSEFNDGRKLPEYKWKTSVADWFRQSFGRDYTDEQVEHRLLSYLPFFPVSDGKRTAKIINTDIGKGSFIHELFIENTEKPDAEALSIVGDVKDVVLVHGYAASLGLFFDNFDLLSAVPGIRIHAIDLPGFGLSARPKYPKFGAETKEDIYANENWFIDAMEEWRKRRGIDRFVLIGHSFGGYLSCAYALKYNTNLLNAATGVSQRMIEKLVLVSPVGVERHENSLLKNELNDKIQVTPAERARLNKQNPQLDLQKEVSANQEDIVQGRGEATAVKEQPAEELRQRRFVRWLWERNASPFAIVRGLGPIRSKAISRWTSHRFSHIYFNDPEQFQTIHNYFYRIFNAAGSGEYAITRVLAFGALARMPLLDRCPEKFVQMGLPTLWMYGDKDWMNEEAGLEMTKEINRLSEKEGKGVLASFSVLKNAGHHLYLDNPPDFAKVIFKFMKR